MQAQIGQFRFEAAPGAAEYQSLARQRQRRWAARERHGQPPLLEDLGREADTLDLAGTLWVSTGDDLRAFDALKREAGLQQRRPGDDDVDLIPLAVFLGGSDSESGEHIGQWVVTRLHEREHDLRFDGVPARVDFEITLREFIP